MQCNRTRTFQGCVFSLVGIGVIALGSVMGATPANAQSAETPIIVTEPVEGRDCDETWTETETRTGTRTGVEEYTYEVQIPGKDAVTHKEFRYNREVPAVKEVSHQEYQYEKTQYHFREFARRWDRTWTNGFWQEFSPNNDQGTFYGPPSWPDDPRGTWSDQKANGGPQESTSGVFQNGEGNGSWFYRKQGSWSQWSSSDWTPSVPESQPSWRDDTTPIGEPVVVESGDTSYREVQIRWDQGTQTVTGGWTTDQLLPPWTKVHDQRKVVDVEALDGYTAYYVDGGAPTTELTDANWTTKVQPDDWTLLDRRTVTDARAIPPRTEERTGTREVAVEHEYQVEVEYRAGWPCEVPSVAGPTDPTPSAGPTDPTPSAGSTEPTPPAGVAGASDELPVTGTSYAPAIAIVAMGLLVGGATLTALGHSRKVDGTRA